MALDDLLEDVEQYPVGSVNSRMKGENIPVSDKAWLHILCHTPETAYTVITFSSVSRSKDEESMARKFVSLLDQIIQDDIDGMKVSDEERDRAERQRDEIIGEYL